MEIRDFPFDSGKSSFALDTHTHEKNICWSNIYRLNNNKSYESLFDYMDGRSSVVCENPVDNENDGANKLQSHVIKPIEVTQILLILLSGFATR